MCNPTSQRMGSLQAFFSFAQSKHANTYRKQQQRELRKQNDQEHVESVQFFTPREIRESSLILKTDQQIYINSCLLLINISNGFFICGLSLPLVYVIYFSQVLFPGNVSLISFFVLPLSIQVFFFFDGLLTCICLNKLLFLMFSALINKTLLKGFYEIMCETIVGTKQM